MIVCLHGFLGKGSDWDPFVDQFSRATGSEVHAPDLFGAPIRESIPEWSDRFASSVGKSSKPCAIVGYSLGGRLALHTIVRHPDLFHGAVIVSAGLGIADEAARSARAATDEEWARRFEVEPWSDLMNAWNSQAVFSGSGFSPPRVESDFRRDSLAAALRLWSPATCESLESMLPDLRIPILWIAGERDRKYAEEASRAAALAPKSSSWIAPGAGHRVPWEVPGLFSERVSHYLSELFSR